MAKRIVRRNPKEHCLSGLADLQPILQRIYAARNVNSTAELDRELTGLHPYASLLNIEKAAERLASAIQDQQKILIIGDFDADGATSTALAMSALKKFGALNIDFLVPNRFKFGYGLTPEIVEVASEKNPKLIITVDNGIASHAGVLRANSLGIDVVITDHHLQGTTLPEAFAIVNPNQHGDEFPSKCMAGVGVIFYVMLATRQALKQRNWFDHNALPYPSMVEFLDLVALGTVADVVPLDKNNRIFVHQGLRRIQAGYARLGILALLKVAGKEPASINVTGLGFLLGPRLNAAGRLDDMSLGIACLLAEDQHAASSMAKQLDELNHERRAIEMQMQKEAFVIVEKLQFANRMPAGICLYDEHWHQGVVGLVASRIKEKFNRPVIAFAKVDETTLKGSARSVESIHIRDILDAIATRHPDLLSKFGGHAMAAGLSIAIDAYDRFRDIFAQEVAAHIPEEELYGRIETDGELISDEFSMQTAELLRNAGPWGQSFPEPVFDGVFQVVDQRLVGQRHLKMTVRLPESALYLEAIAFNVDAGLWPNPRCERVQMAYKLDINEYQGRHRLQLLVEEIIPC